MKKTKRFMFDDLFLTKEEQEKYTLIKLEKRFIREPKELLHDMEIDFYNKLEELKELKQAIISYRRRVIEDAKDAY